MKLGARIFKTGLSIILSLYLAMFFGLYPAMFAALAATFAIQPSIHRSFQTIIEQIQANVIGALLAVIFVLTLGHEPFVIGLVAVLAIAIILKLKLEVATIPLAIVTVIIIMESPAENFIEFATIRFLLILVGVFSAFIVNLLFIPPRYETKLFHQLITCTEQIIQWMMLVVRKDADRKALIKDISYFNEKMFKIENIYLLYKEERNYFLKSKYTKARKVVLFRHMLTATKKAFIILKQLERREHEIHHLPEETQKLLEEHLDRLTIYHDRILLRYAGKVNASPTEEFLTDVTNGKLVLTEAFMSLYDKKVITQEEWMHILPIISQITEYQEQLVHLARLVDSFFSYHKQENKVTIKNIDD